MLHVAVGVVIDATKNILVAQRSSHSTHAGLWEFPGGKVESGEDIYSALCREFKEEVGLEVISAKPLIKINHQYDQYSVLLDTWLITQYDGEAKGVEGQTVRWVSLSELMNLKIPEANSKIIELLSVLKA